MTDRHDPLIAGQTFDAWNRLWVSVPGGLKEYQPSLRFMVGLYRISLKGRTMALGTGTDKSGGIAKRLSDFRRASASGRRHYAGQRIHEELDRLEVEVLTTGSGPQGREIARKLKEPMIRFHRPDWTVSNTLLATKT